MIANSVKLQLFPDARIRILLFNPLVRLVNFTPSFYRPFTLVVKEVRIQDVPYIVLIQLRAPLVLQRALMPRRLDLRLFLL